MLLTQFTANQPAQHIHSPGRPEMPFSVILPHQAPHLYPLVSLVAWDPSVYMLMTLDGLNTLEAHLVSNATVDMSCISQMMRRYPSLCKPVIVVTNQLFYYWAINNNLSNETELGDTKCQYLFIWFFLQLNMVVSVLKYLLTIFREACWIWL